MITQEFQKTILSQYSNSTNMLAILERFNIAVDPSADIEKFFVEVFDLDTCGEYGLKVWGTIVAAPRGVRVVRPNYFGFRRTGFQPFNQKPFFNGQRNAEEIQLDTELYRALIYFKAAANIMNTTIPEINRLLWQYFDIRGIQGECWAEEVGTMKIRVLFRFNIPYVDRAIFRTYGHLLRPGGVKFVYNAIWGKTFGFNGVGNVESFGHGKYYDGAIRDDFYHVD